MGKLAQLLRGKKNKISVPDIQCTTLRGKFLDLPGEIRNQIYSYIIYPDLHSVTIANCAIPEHLAASVLHLPLFRTSHQIRAEALSYLCANIPLRILGVRTANVFFSWAGSAVSDIKSLTIAQVVLDVRRDNVDKFFEVLDTMHGLVEVRLEIVEKFETLEKCKENVEFMRRIKTLEERGVHVWVGSTNGLRGL
ncbi:hypothetical protein Ptr902_05097 [Pyrenophora tritici-repentis]|nr:hypothetical protein Ptr902_05097 [Pyrenophora tritici-repentis]